MGFRSFRMRQGVALRRVLGVFLAVGGMTILLYIAPSWVWYCLLAIALMGAGWFLFHYK
ncbi:hypothetical protein GCM10023228_22980 [Brevibacillus fulvus]|uniref:Glucose dehydrogenase n=1 Tax=Brevibacillus fulvus TaxID=1125967 RepID=A0A939BUC9_9BACL|nr:glucose dehydrogenase [Brevibacillus fulvus]